MATCEVHQGSVVEILDATEKQTIYKTKIHNYNDAGYVLEVPIKNGVICVLPQDATYTMRCRHGRGANDLSFAPDGFFFDGNVACMQTKFIGQIAFIQQRHLFRVACHIPIKCTWIDDLFNRGYFNGTVVDLSGGGAKIRTQKPQVLNSIISFDLLLADDTYPLKAKIMSVKECSIVRHTNLCGVQFIEIAQPMQDEIVAHVHKLQGSTRKGKFYMAGLHG